MRVSLSGQSLSEYILAAALVAMVALGSFSVLSAPLSASLAQLLDTIFEGRREGGAPSEALPEQRVPLAASGEMTVSLPSGQSFFLSNYPFNLSKSVETAGANGTTKKLLANLSDLTQQLLDSGEINEEQENLLKELANQGHVIAEFEKALEDASSNSASIEDFLDTVVYVNGRNRKIRHMYGDIAIYGENHARLEQGMSLSEISVSAGGGGSQMARFIELYRQVEASGALSTPQAKQIVSDLSSKIALIAAEVESTMDNYVDFPSSTRSPDITRTAASRLTNDHSGGICDTGGGKDSGIHCS